MKVFVTGGTGLIGAALLPELLQAGHRVIALARSETSTAQLTAAGVDVVMGTLNDLDVLRRHASEADAVIHLAFDHDFSKFKESSEADKLAIETLGEALDGSQRRLFVSTGIPLNASAYPVSEKTVLPAASPTPRVSELVALSLRERGVIASVIRLPQVHNRAKQGLITSLRSIARVKGVSAYVGSGESHWSAAHVHDVARLYRLAVDATDSLPIYHAVAEENLSMKDIATAIGQRNNVPVISIPEEEATGHFGFFGRLVARDLSATSALTRQHLAWTPTGVGLIDDLEHATD